jgi:hypothetical protein
LAVCFHTLQAQEVIDSFVTQFESLASNQPAEMIYLQTGKGIYETGEDLWFKAYLLDAQTHYLSGRSQTLYLQMVSESNGQAVWQEKYPIENGIADGHVYVQDTLSAGNYFLEAYTHYSFYGDSTEFSALRRVKIQKDISQSDTAKTLPTAEGFRFETFPEGGNLIAGISSKLAFKATDGHGYPVDVSGALYQDDTLLLEFASVHAGMGLIQFTPLQDKTYQIRLANGETYPLPEIFPYGMTLRLTEQGSEFLRFTISQSEGLPKQNFYLTGQLRSMVCCVAKGLLKSELNVKIPLNEFPGQGIAVFTLFNEKGLPVAERLVYVHPKKKLYITVSQNKKVYRTRENARIKIKVTDEKGQPVIAHLGVSVFEALYNNPNDPANILTHVYLSSQIRGKIYDPASCFDEKNKDRKAAMELLLLTQGWRRYVWQADNLKPKGQAVVTDEITGIQTVKRKKEKSLEQFILVSDVNDNSQWIETDSTGYFAIDAGIMKNLQRGYLYLKPLLSKEFKPELNIEDPFSSINKIRPVKETFYPLANRNDRPKEETARPPVIRLDSVIALDEIVVTAKAQRPFRDKYMGHLDSLAQKDFGPWVCEHGWLENYLPGYTHHHDPTYCPWPNDAGKHSLPVIGKTYYIMKAKYYDNHRFDVEDEKYITYQGPNYSDEELLKMNNLWRVKGYYSTPEFYQPDDMEIFSSLPDARNTLLWAPSIITDEKGEATVSFYSSDINTGFTGRIEGVGGTGLLGATTFEFRVINPKPLIGEAGK